jgi:hypothetical protein
MPDATAQIRAFVSDCPFRQAARAHIEDTVV